MDRSIRELIFRILIIHLAAFAFVRFAHAEPMKGVKGKVLAKKQDANKGLKPRQKNEDFQRLRYSGPAKISQGEKKVFVVCTILCTREKCMNSCKNVPRKVVNLSVQTIVLQEYGVQKM